MKEKIKKIILALLILSTLIIVFIVGVNLYVLSFSKKGFYNSVEDLNDTYVWLVFWAAVYNNSRPSDILRDRLDVAIEAYNTWKITKIIVSGDNSKLNYNEPVVMKNYLIANQVKKEDIYTDYAWFDTFASLYRARDIFGVEELILFTQDFHLKRAMYISKRLWIKTQWVHTNLRPYIREWYYDIREIWARVKAFLNVEIFKSKPKYLGDTIEILRDEKIEETKKEILND